MKTETLINNSLVKPTRAYLSKEDTLLPIYELVVDFENRYFEYNVNSNDFKIHITFNKQDTTEISVLEFDLSDDIDEDNKDCYDLISRIHVVKEKEQLIISIYPSTNEFSVLDKVIF